MIVLPLPLSWDPETLSEGKLIQYCDWSDTPKECAESLLNAVEEAEVPRQDNTTVVVVNVVDKDAVIAASEPETALGANVDVNADTTTDLTDTISEEIELSSPEGMPEPVEEAVAEEEEEPDSSGDDGGSDDYGILHGGHRRQSDARCLGRRYCGSCS